MDELKFQYNNLLERYIKNGEYMDCYHLQGEELAKAVAEREKFIPKIRELLLQMDKLLKQIGKYTETEAMEGFEVLEKAV